VELSPPVLQSAGLPSALAWLADWTRRKYGLDVHVSANPLADSPRKDIRTLLFESVRELLFNVVKHAQVNQVTVDLTVDVNGNLRITVADRGVGFDPVELDKRVTNGQVGWGLFSIRERLTFLRGQFDIDSAPGSGTRFHLIAPSGVAQGDVGTESPLTHRVIGLAPGASAASVESARALKILIVDDHPGVREALRGLFQARSEFQIVGEAANGLEAIALAHALRPDVVLMDVSMPEMDGVEATRRIRAELPFIQILALTMYPRTEDRHAIELAGAECFFTKGVDTQRLINHLLIKHASLPSWLPR
jgi:CheY-like chemotaxis protein/anti-sigma regulatory factor (Ser/Thr protein kinase)